MADNNEAGSELSSQHSKMKMLNVLLLGLCFFFVFAGFNTMGQTQALVYSSADSTGEKPGFNIKFALVELF